MKRLFPTLPNSTGLGYRRHPLPIPYLHQLARDAGQGAGVPRVPPHDCFKAGRGGVSASAISALTGHGTVLTVLEKFYIDRMSLPDRVATLARFNPPILRAAYNVAV
ncbi:hypothetical protein FHT16_002161 [Xanthomonas arboricola]